ncbi:hypothetical protein GIB67_023241 [Kingdonia uniflora]|uniref:Leucine-rich repeat-containing N-terminal plant-type domain-containing protein n=1 Tax=Kingdonia uniflora TaxID=39325 RepID=A0A7J7LM01_9MAGN|nr:hypothetical protein GIB67_023241 [Kingdonia uniflora]
MQFLTLVFLFLVHIVSGNLDLDALLELKKGFKEEPLRGNYLSSWNINNVESNNGGCPKSWYGIDCEGGHVTSIVLRNLGLVGSFNFLALVGIGMIQNLSISNNQFTGIISPNIGSIGSLRFLDLSANSFHGSIPNSLIKMENLALLNLSSNSFRGTVAVEVGELEQLRYLDLRCNRFYGNIAGVLMQLQKVVYVDLSSNLFSGYLDLGLADASFVSTV